MSWKRKALVYALLGDECGLSDCDNKSHARSLCQSHYTRLREWGDPTHPRIPSPRGRGEGWHHSSETKAKIGRANSTHGLSDTPTWVSWSSMKDRCYNPNSDQYRWYGGRGIAVCGRWLGEDGFENFLADMGERPHGLTLDRIDSDGNYEPGNCRWADSHVQRINRSSAGQGATADERN